jgi:hypothetical protein
LAYVYNDVDDVGGEDDDAAGVESEVLEGQASSGKREGVQSKAMADDFKEGGGDGDAATPICAALHLQHQRSIGWTARLLLR